MTKILDPFIYGLPPPVWVIRKSKSVKIDAFKLIGILETIRVEWGEDWFTTSQLVNWLQRKNIDEDLNGIRMPLHRLVLKNYLKKELRAVQEGERTVRRMCYALGKASKDYSERYETFFNTEGNLFKNKLRLYQKIKSGHAAVF